MEDDSSIEIESSGNLEGYFDDEYIIDHGNVFDAFNSISSKHYSWSGKSQTKKKRILDEFYSIIDLRRNGNHDLPAAIRMAIDQTLGPLVLMFMERVRDEIKEGIFNKRLLSTDCVSVKQVETMVRLFPNVIDGEVVKNRHDYFDSERINFEFSINNALRGENGLGIESKRRAIKSIPFIPTLVGLAKELKIKPYSKEERWGLLSTYGKNGMNVLQTLSDCSPITEWDDTDNLWDVLDDDDSGQFDYADIDDDYDNDRDYNGESDQVKLDALKKLRQSKLFLRSDVRKYDLVHYTCRESPTLLAVTKSSVFASSEELRDQYMEFVELDGTITEENFWNTHKSILKARYTSMTKLTAKCFSSKRFKYLIGFDPTALGSKSNTMKFDGGVPLHMCINSKKIFNTVFEEGMKRFPQNFGFLFYNNDSNITPYELACKEWGTRAIGNKMWKKLDIARKKLELVEHANIDERDKGDKERFDETDNIESRSRRNSLLSTENLIVVAASNPHISLDCVYLLFQRDPSVATFVAARLSSPLPCSTMTKKETMNTAATKKRKRRQRR